MAVLLSVVAAEAQALTKGRVPLADPFILLDNGTYYAYGTRSKNGIVYYTSNDLKIWRYGGLALHKKNSYGEKWFWAPEVYLVDGVYYMYYTADERTCVATSSSPVGPFVQRESLETPSERANQKGVFDSLLFPLRSERFPKNTVPLRFCAFL